MMQTFREQPKLPPTPFDLAINAQGSGCGASCSHCAGGSRADQNVEQCLPMSQDVLEETIRTYLQAHSGPIVTFYWHGPDPLMLGLEFFEVATTLQKKYAAKDVIVYNTIQTDATLIDAGWCSFFKANGFRIGVNLHGPKRLHNAARRASAKESNFAKVYRGLKWLQTTDTAYHVTCEVSSYNSEFPGDVYGFFQEESVNRIQFVPVVTHASNGEVAESTVDPDKFGRFMCEVFNAWIKRDVGRIHIEHFDAALDVFMNNDVRNCVHADTCGRTPLVGPEGTVFSCEHFTDSKYMLGNVAQGSVLDRVGLKAQSTFGSDKQDSLPGCCRECEVLFLCNGGCPKDRFVMSSDGQSGLNYLCTGYKTFFRHIAPLMNVMAMMRENEIPISVINQVLQQTM